MIKLDSGSTIIDEDKFLQVTILRTKGYPYSAVTIAAIHNLEKYILVKSSNQTQQINASTNQQINHP